MRGHIELVKAIEELIASYPGAVNIKSNNSKTQLQPAQANIAPDIMTSKYEIPLICQCRDRLEYISVRFMFDKRIRTGHILINSEDIGLLVDKDIDNIDLNGHVIRQLYKVVGERRANISCYKCGHVIEHECW